MDNRKLEWFIRVGGWLYGSSCGPYDAFDSMEEFRRTVLHRDLHTVLHMVKGVIRSIYTLVLCICVTSIKVSV